MLKNNRETNIKQPTENNRLSPESAEKESDYLSEYLNSLYPEQKGIFTTEQYENAYKAIMDSFYYTDAKVYITRKCTGDCPFCLTDIRPTTKETEAKDFLSEFKKRIDEYTQNHGRKVLFTGGEPTSDPEKLLGCLDILKDYDLDLVVLYTNGINLLEEIEYKGKKETIVKLLKDAGLKHINLSVHHFNQNERLRLSTKIGEIDTQKIIEKIDEAGIELRLNCTLMKDFVGNLDQVKKYINWASENNVNDIYFRNLFKLAKRDKTTIRMTEKSMEKLLFTDKQRIDFEELVAKTQNDDDFDFKDQLSRHRDWGSTYVFKHKPTNTSISFGSLEIGGEKPEEDTYYTIHPDAVHTKNMNIAKNTIEDLSEINQ